MTLTEQMTAGLELMVLGMGIVFIFLTILIFSLRGMTALATALQARTSETSEATSASPRPVTDHGAADPAVVLAITAAVNHYRASRNA